ncbi:MAG TPA: MarR family winged helix-turn-helix transcriptional regulator [Gemmatimonadaceae bacterium]|jgi:DNA-binding MarR family transcriptional regulator
MESSSVCYCTAARKAARKLSLFYDQRLAPVGLTVAQYSIVAEIERHSSPPPTITELAAALIMDRSTLGQGLRPLERDGLVQFVENDEDGRSRRVALSKRGRTTFAAAHTLWKSAQREYAGLLGRDTADHARAVMNGLVSANQF